VVLEVKDSDKWCKDALEISACKLGRVSGLPLERLGDHGNESSFDHDPTSKLLCIGKIAFITA
jgi:hypothetical protein